MKSRKSMTMNTDRTIFETLFTRKYKMILRKVLNYLVVEGPRVTIRRKILRLLSRGRQYSYRGFF